MNDTLPMIFMALCASALVAAVFLFSRSFAAVFGDASVDDTLPRVMPEDQQALLDQKRALLVALRDLELERQLGKVSDEDFKRLEAQYRARARRVLQELDGSVAPYRDDAERAIAAHLKKRGVTTKTPAPEPESSPPVEPAAEPSPSAESAPVPSPPEGEGEGTIGTSEPGPEPSSPITASPSVEAPPEATNAKSAPTDPRTCAGCATVNDADATFCKKCGTKLETPSA